MAVSGICPSPPAGKDDGCRSRYPAPLLWYMRVAWAEMILFCAVTGVAWVCGVAVLFLGWVGLDPMGMGWTETRQALAEVAVLGTGVLPALWAWYGWAVWAMWHTAVDIRWEEDRVKWYNLVGKGAEAPWQELAYAGRPWMLWRCLNWFLLGFVPGSAIVCVAGPAGHVRVPYLFSNAEAFLARLRG